MGYTLSVLIPSKEDNSDIIILNRNAHQKPSTENPETILSANNIIIALITSKNNPKLNIVNGMVRSTSIGFRNPFSKASINATIIAVKKSFM